MEDDPNFPKHNSVDAIITDPPYVEDWRENWAPFLGIAADILKPGGFLISYVGHIRLPEFFAALEETQIESPSKVSKNNKLEFHWICALEHKGAITAVHTRSVQCGFKPILIAFKPPARKPYQYLNDLLQGSGREKDLHEWQQGVSELIPLLDAFTKPGDVVLDPFMGSGTTAVACKMTARRFVGYDNVQENVDNATSRILQLDK
jgi:site-specific DNA-methyltransferase (adenine-specific)